MPGLTSPGTAPHSCRVGRAARSGHPESQQGRCSSHWRGCSGPARTRMSAGNLGPTGQAGRCIGLPPLCKASCCRSKGSGSDGPTSPDRTGRSRWQGHSASSKVCTGTVGGTWTTTSPVRSGTRPLPGRSARVGRRCTQTRSAHPSGPLNSGTCPWLGRTGHVGGRCRSHGSQGPNTDLGSLEQAEREEMKSQERHKT